MRFALLIFVLAFLLPCAEAHAQIATLVSNVDMGTSESPAGANVTNIIGTNSTISYGAGNSGPAAGIAGQIQINGTAGCRIRVGCENSDSARNVGGTGGNQDISWPQIRMIMGASNVAGPGVGLICNGAGNTLIDVTRPANAADRMLYFGGSVVTNNVMVGGQYRASNHPNGTITVRVRQSGGGACGNTTLNLGLDLRSDYVRPFTLTNLADVDFGLVEMAALPSGSDQANLGTNGSITYAGNFTGTGTGTAGAIRVVGPANGTNLVVYCDQNAILTRTGGSIQMTNIQVASETARGAFGTGSVCNGLTGAPAMTFTFQSTTRDEVYVGGRLNGGTASGTITGSMSTANAGGNPIEVIVVYP